MQTNPEEMSVETTMLHYVRVFGKGFLWMQIHGLVIDIRNKLLFSSLFQLILIMLVRRGGFTKMERLYCWTLLREARQGRNLEKIDGKDEWDELLDFVARGLLRQGERHFAYRRNGYAFWWPELSVL